MNRRIVLRCAMFLFTATPFFAQDSSSVVDAIVKEVNENSNLEALGHELMDDIGPRLVGTPQMQRAHEWAVEKFNAWGISAENQEYGTWKAWERGITHVDMVHPRVQSLSATQLAWSPSTSKKGVTAELITLPSVQNEEEFKKWLPNVKGKLVMIARKESTGRPDYNWKEYATPASFEKMKKERTEQIQAWNQNMQSMGHNKRSLIEVLENAGAAGIVDSYWSKGFGVNKIFGANTKRIPTVDIELEHYSMLYRMVEHGDQPKLHIIARSKDLGVSPTYNTLAEIKGTEKPEEYVILSAHFDSWDGGTGATDNGTGVMVMMEAMRVLKKLNPNPKRTIIAGLWGSEEQGLNGSSAFAEDHPEIVNNIQAVFNQDNGTGRVVRINGQGFLHSYDFLSRWLSAVPDDIRNEIETTFPGRPSSGGSDHSSFVTRGAPAFMLSSLSWDYWNYTWHTNRDTYDKIVFDDVRSNAILVAIMAYMASEDEQSVSKEKIVLPIDKTTGKPQEWPTPRTAERKGGM